MVDEYSTNPGTIAARIWQLNNPEKYAEYRRKYRTSVKGKEAKLKDEAKYKASGKRAASERRRALKPLSPARKVARKRWRDRNKAYFTADRAYRRFLTRVSFMSQAERAEALAMYEFCRYFPEFEVDHIIPVKGKSVSGLHVLSNLQVLPRKENRSKGAKFDPDAIGAEPEAILFE